MVADLHTAGLEVLLDVVYNHTCEGGIGGPTLSWRGLDNALYYRTDGGRYRDVTGTGNSLDSSQPEVVRQTLDSLRYWVQQMGVDGFRFDLAPALARVRDDERGDRRLRPRPPVPRRRADRPGPGRASSSSPSRGTSARTAGGPVSCPCRSWTGTTATATGCATFWLDGSRAEQQGRPGPGVRDLATRLAGSDDMFGGPRRTGVRTPLSGVNFIAAHDGFTLADLVSYEDKHNEANGEDNRDGHGHNLSWNHGHEGPTDDLAVQESRRRTLRAMLGTLAVSTGVPMLLAGDELGRTQRGNNNGYCLDDDTTWHDWSLAPWQRDLLETTSFLLRPARRCTPCCARSGSSAPGRSAAPTAPATSAGSTVTATRSPRPAGRTRGAGPC